MLNKRNQSLEDRKYHTSTDGRFKITMFLKDKKLLNKTILFLSNSIFLSIRKIFSLKKKNDTKNVVIIAFHRLGDTVSTIPAIKEIIKQYDKHNIYILTYPETKNIYSIAFNQDMIKTIGKGNFKFLRKYITKEGRKIFNDLKPEIVIDLTGTLGSASLIIPSAAKKIFGINVDYVRTIYNKFIPIRTTPHFMDMYMDVVKAIFPGNYSDDLFKFKTEIKKDGSILIHPFAIHNPKEWNLKKFISLADSLNQNYKVELISPPGFIQTDVAEEINRLNIQLVITESVGDLIEKIKECSLYISNDSGPTFIASQLGKPTFTIYGPTNPDYSHPFEKNHRYIQKVLKCSAKTEKNEKRCFTRGGIFCPHLDCMNLLSVEEVEREVRKFIVDLDINKKTIFKKDKVFN